MNPEKSFKQAYSCLYVLAVLNVVAAILLTVTAQDVWTAAICAVGAVVFGALGALAHNTKALWPVIVGGIIVLLDVLVSVGFALYVGDTPGIWSTIIKCAFIGAISQAVLDRVRVNKMIY